MTEYTKLIERLRDNTARHDDESRRLCNEAADAIKALQAENASLKQIAELNAQIAIDLKAERDALQSQLDAMGKGEPVGYVGAGYLTLGEGRISEHATEVYKVPVYAAPKALAPLTDEQIYNVFAATVEDAEPFSELVGDPIWADVVEITRAIEAAHGIGGTP